MSKSIRINSRRAKNRRRKASPFGFTLIEMVIVIAIIAILLSMAVSSYIASIKRARDATMKQNLFTLRHVIQEYTLDKQRAPQSLEDLKEAGYIKEVPTDPCTKLKDWRVDQEDVLLAVDQNQPGITDIHSVCPLLDSGGQPYSEY